MPGFSDGLFSFYFQLSEEMISTPSYIWTYIKSKKWRTRWYIRRRIRFTSFNYKSVTLLFFIEKSCYRVIRYFVRSDKVFLPQKVDAVSCGKQTHMKETSGHSLKRMVWHSSAFKISYIHNIESVHVRYCRSIVLRRYQEQQKCFTDQWYLDFLIVYCWLMLAINFGCFQRIRTMHANSS